MSELDWIIELAKITIPALIVWIAAKKKNEADAVKSLLEGAAGSLMEQYIKRNKQLTEQVDALRGHSKELDQHIIDLEGRLMNHSIGFQINTLLLRKCGVSERVSTADLNTMSYDELKAIYLDISNS